MTEFWRLKLIARLTKAARPCKAGLRILTLSLFCVAAAQATAGDLRDCIAKARNAGAVASCEQVAQSASKKNIQRLSTAIRKRLNGGQRQVFDRSTKAWQAFLENESSLLKLTLSLRGDGLDTKLQQGGITRLYEQREQQLREHLHNLSIARSDAGADKSKSSGSEQ